MHQVLRHVIGVVLAVVMAAAVFFAASWGYMRVYVARNAYGANTPTSLIHNTHILEGVGTLLAVGLLAGLLMAIPWVSPLATGLPGLALIGWTVLFLVNVPDAIKYIPLKAYDTGYGFEQLLINGLLGAVGLAMVVPLFVPSRWVRRVATVPAGTAVPSADLTQTTVAGYPVPASSFDAPTMAHENGGLLSDWSQTRPQPQINPNPPRSQAPWGPADYS
jgi:hypothetical protein